MSTILNKELKDRLNELEEPNKSILEKLLTDIEVIKQRDEVRSTLRSQIRESVMKEMRM